MKLIIGLGNPGKEYQNTRHNIGQNTVNQIMAKLGLSPKAYPKLQASLAKDGDLLIGSTTTYMNLSGESVQSIANFFKIDPSDVYLIHDDLDLAVGEWKLQFDRGSAGHNGVKSVAQHLGTQAFHRIRIGVDHPRNSSNPNLPVEDYVLLPFSPDELVIIKPTIDKIVQDFDKLIS